MSESVAALDPLVRGTEGGPGKDDHEPNKTGEDSSSCPGFEPIPVKGTPDSEREPHPPLYHRVLLHFELRTWVRVEPRDTVNSTPVTLSTLLSVQT